LAVLITCVKMRSKIGTISLSIYFVFSFVTNAQSGGNNTYDFLNLTNSARVASLGGQQISIFDDDLNFTFHNPSLLNASMDNHLVLNYVDYFMDINYGYVSYARSRGDWGNWAAGIHYISYGKFREVDESNLKKGEFRADDYALNLIYSRTLKDSMFYVGVNVKPIFSDYESYRSVGLAFDAGITYVSSNHLFSAALVVKNTGFQIKRYYKDHPREPLPFEIQLGISQKLHYAPFRFSVLAQHLEKWDLRYKTLDDLEPTSSFTPENENKVDQFFDNFMRHFILGVEFLPSDNFNIRLGYNYKRRQELKIDDKLGMVGFSWGFGLRIKKFHVSYGRATYHLAGASNHFSVSTNLSEFYKNF
jgi:hypothetical protein